MESRTKFKIDPSAFPYSLRTVDQDFLAKVDADSVEDEESEPELARVAGESDDAMIVDIHCVSDSVFQCDPDDIDVTTLAVENGNGSKTLTCDVYARCGIHRQSVPSGGVYVELTAMDGEATKLTSMECVENVLTSRGLATVETHVINNHKILFPCTITSTQGAAENRYDAITDDDVITAEDATDIVTEDDDVTDVNKTDSVEGVMDVVTGDVTDVITGEEDGDVTQYNLTDVTLDENVEAAENRAEFDVVEGTGDDDSNMNEVHVAVEVHTEEHDAIEALVGDTHLKERSRHIYGCSQCEFKSTNASVARGHVREKQGAHIRYICGVCDTAFNNSGNLLRHKLTHDKIKPFPCHQCQKRFGQKAHLHRHLSVQKPALQCRYCPYSSVYKCAMLEHGRQAHPGDPRVKYDTPADGIVWECGVCEYECSSKRDLAQHMKHHTSRTPLNYKCDTCSFVTDYPCRLKRHLLSHTQERPFRCSICDYRGSQIEHVIRHMRKVHQSEPKHTLDSGDDPRYTTVLPATCNIDSLRKTGTVCDIASSERSAFTRDAGSSTLYACTLCHLGFQKPKNLQKHIDDVHRGETNRYTCSICHNHSANPELFIQHLNSHKPPAASVEYRCSYCEFTTEKRRNFVYHMLAKHYKIVHFGSRNSIYGVSDACPGTTLGPHDVLMTTVHEKDDGHATLGEAASNAGNESEDETSQAVVQVSEGDLIQIDDVLYRVEPS